MKKIFLLQAGIIVVLTLLMLSIGCSSLRNIPSPKEMEAINLYELFNEGGMNSQTGVFGVFSSVQTDSVRTIPIVGSELDTLKAIMSEAEKSKRWKIQYKTTPHLLFFEMTDSDNAKHRMWLDHNVLTDLDADVMYFVKDIDHKQWLSSFYEKYTGEYLDIQ
ncbi:MAG: hypothetical protein KBT49_05610 [Bacteroidetes bacterium]|nr:hypothetical protein [Candidatus Colenecus caballi]